MPKKPFNKILHGDCIEVMGHLPDACVDLVVTDPPFAIDFKTVRSNYNRTSSRVMEGYTEIRARDYAAFTQRWMAEAKRLLKASGSLFVFSGWNHLKDLLVVADALELTTVNHIIWKYQFGVACKKRFVTSHYHCLYLCKDDAKRKFFPNARHGPKERNAEGRSLRYRDMEDVWQIPREYWHGDIKTPTKLPAEVIRKILAYTSEEGDVVLDPFLGSGQVAVVSHEMKRKYIGIEIVEGYVQFAKERLEEGRYRIRERKPKARKRRKPVAK
ncbi:MAG: DNA-methyltransferase [Planctomycetota bacterium]|jgi:site-specific DNA-methyltransferase (adenine-specific)